MKNNQPHVVQVRKADEVLGKFKKQVAPVTVKVSKHHESPAPEPVAAPVAAPEPPPPHVQASAQIIEVEPGVFDILVTCSCGERTVVRCLTHQPG